VHLVGFTIEICYDARHYERQITLYTLVLVLLVYFKFNPLEYEINLKYIKNSFPAEKRRHCLHVTQSNGLTPFRKLLVLDFRNQ